MLTDDRARDHSATDDRREGRLERRVVGRDDVLDVRIGAVEGAASRFIVIELDEGGASPRARHRDGDRGGDRALPDAALTGDVDDRGEQVMGDPLRGVLGHGLAIYS